MPRQRPEYRFHRDEALYIMGCMPVRKMEEDDKAFERRKIAAATKMENDHGLTPIPIPGKRARRYGENQLLAARAEQDKRTQGIAA